MTLNVSAEVHMTEDFELMPSELRCFCNPAQFGFNDTSQIEPLDVVIGQQRAVQAIDFGLGMRSPGYNIFVTGYEGTGKTTIVEGLVKKTAAGLETACDWCMVNNFKDEFRPRAIALPSGQALIFAKKMENFIEIMKARLPREFEDKPYQNQQAGIRTRFEEKRARLFEDLEKLAGEKNLQINRTPSGYQTIPLAEGKPMRPEEYKHLPEEKKKEFEENVKLISAEIENTLREATKINNALQKEVEQLMQKVALFIVKERLDIVRDDYTGCNQVLEYLGEVQAHIVENVNIFLMGPEEAEAIDRKPLRDPQSAYNVYRVNVLVNRSGPSGAPVVYEPNPNYHNVIGQIEKRAFMGMLTTDFTRVQAGSLLEANGGFLIMEIEAVLMNAGVWEALKRALQNKQLFIENAHVSAGLATASLRPLPIPLEVKVILLGSYQAFEMLQNHDSKFNKIFKVRADFDYETNLNDETVQLYARFIARVCRQENLLPFTPEGVATIIEFAEKFIANKKKLSLRFGQIVSIIKEADYWARKENTTQVTDIHVLRAFNEYRFRYNLYEEKMQERLADHTIMVDVDGAVEGQVNALAVYQIGDFQFGRPSRITAETFMGKDGVINIEREANLSGRTHDKGVMILSGFLGRTFAQKFPLNLNISITFEQSYSGVDGDSASSTELYAILSSLASIPIKQGIAVTGSVNQKGQVQAIGGVNQKIEGFYDLCQSRGLTGKQGVMIPASNVQNLMLKKEVITAVENGQFHIYQVTSVEDGIEVLTGMPAGRPDDRGDFPKDSVFGAVQTKLKTYTERAMKLKNQFRD
jgi:lon-related putative ATP-dependent protease